MVRRRPVEPLVDLAFDVVARWHARTLLRLTSLLNGMVLLFGRGLAVDPGRSRVRTPRRYHWSAGPMPEAYSYL